MLPAARAEAHAGAEGARLLSTKSLIRALVQSQAMQSHRRPDSSVALQASPDAAMYSPSVYVTVFDLDTRFVPTINSPSKR